MNERSAFPVFVNYRRELSARESRLLYLMLNARFPGQVFMDNRKIRYGRKWREEIDRRLEQSKVVLVMIPKGWLEYAGELKTKSKLCFGEECFVRYEIIKALELDKTIIPVLIDGADLPAIDFFEDKAEAIQAVHDFQGPSLDFENPDIDDFNRLFREIAREAGIEQSENESGNNLLQKPIEVEFPLPSGLASRLPDASSPYVGLKPFRRADARLYFGRSLEVFDLCFKILREDRPRLFLLDGYSGTGKSSLLQAGLLPRVEADPAWIWAYGRREQGRERGLPQVFGQLLETTTSRLKAGKTRQLIVLDQLEEAIVDPIEGYTAELEDLKEAIISCLQDHPNCKIVLSYRSEYAARITRLLDGLDFDDQNRLHPLDRNGVLEAITGVTGDEQLNREYRLSFSSPDLPAAIADRLLKSRDNYQVAPLLQVNMQLLWERCRNGPEVRITGRALESFIEREEELLNHYLSSIREEYSEEYASNTRILKLLNHFVEEIPASATRPDASCLQLDQGEGAARNKKILAKLKKLYLLTELEAGHSRLTHDVLAPLIRKRYEAEQAATGRERDLRQFELLKEKLDEQLISLQYTEAGDSLQELLRLDIRRAELRPLLFELLFFWNEARREAGTRQLLQHWINSGLCGKKLSEAARKILDQAYDPTPVRDWLQRTDAGKYADMQKRYFAPPGSVMVKVKGNPEAPKAFSMGDGTDEDNPAHDIRLSDFSIANIQTTFWKYGIYLYATGQEGRLKEMAPSWGIRGNHPVVNVHWYDAIEYCNWLSNYYGLEPAYRIDKNLDENNLNENDEVRWRIEKVAGSNGFRLPTEAEWEYAARGGKRSKGFEYSGSSELEKVGWYDENSGSQTHAVGDKEANELGLYDMSGNVWEWCWDWYGKDYYRESPEQDPQGPEQGEYRVLRGGSWVNYSGDCRPSYRSIDNPGDRDSRSGFRLSQG